jgi:hypothetical protein
VVDPWYHERVGSRRWSALVEELHAAGAPFAARLADLQEELIALESWLQQPAT